MVFGIGGRERVVAVYNTANPAQQQSLLMGHSAGISAMLYGSGFLFSGSLDCTAIQWHVTSSNRVRSFVGHTGPISAMCLDDTGTQLFTASADCTVRQHGLSLGELVRVFEGHTKPVTAVGCAGGVVITSGASMIRVWDKASGKCRTKYKNETGSVVRMFINKVGDGHGFFELERVIVVGSKGHISELHAHTAGRNTCFTPGRVIDMLNDTSLGNTQPTHRTRPVKCICVRLPQGECAGVLFVGCRDGQVRQLDFGLQVVAKPEGSSNPEADVEDAPSKSFETSFSQVGREIGAVRTICTGRDEKQKWEVTAPGAADEVPWEVRPRRKKKTKKNKKDAVLHDGVDFVAQPGDILIHWHTGDKVIVVHPRMDDPSGPSYGVRMPDGEERQIPSKDLVRPQSGNIQHLEKPPTAPVAATAVATAVAAAAAGQRAVREECGEDTFQSVGECRPAMSPAMTDSVDPLTAPAIHEAIEEYKETSVKRVNNATNMERYSEDTLFGRIPEMSKPEPDFRVPGEEVSDFRYPDTKIGGVVLEQESDEDGWSSSDDNLEELPTRPIIPPQDPVFSKQDMVESFWATSRRSYTYQKSKPSLFDDV